MWAVPPVFAAGTDITDQLLQLYEPEQAQGQDGQQAAAAGQAPTTAAEVMQGVADGSLLLYATQTLTAEQHQRQYPAPAPQQPAQPVAAAAAAPAAEAAPLVPPAAQPPPQQQQQQQQQPGAAEQQQQQQPPAGDAGGGEAAAVEGQPAEDAMDEYDELFAS